MIPSPESFYLFGQRIRVEWREDLVQKTACVGEARLRDNKIYLQPDSEGFPRVREAIEQTFFHELIHVCLDQMGDKKGEDEKFVDLLANLIHQVLSTAEYSEGER